MIGEKTKEFLKNLLHGDKKKNVRTIDVEDVQKDRDEELKSIIKESFSFIDNLIDNNRQKISFSLDENSLLSIVNYEFNKHNIFINLEKLTNYIDFSIRKQKFLISRKIIEMIVYKRKDDDEFYIYPAYYDPEYSLGDEYEYYIICNDSFIEEFMPIVNKTILETKKEADRLLNDIFNDKHGDEEEE